MKYKSVVVRKRGGPEVLQIIENEKRSPAKGEVRIRVLATVVGRTDVNFRYGVSPYSPSIPFIPGYEMCGVVDATGEEVFGLKVGDSVAALTQTGAYAEMIYLPQDNVIVIPSGLDPAMVAIVALNYVTAFQMLTRVAKVKEGDKILILGASGGVGIALIDLGRIFKLKIFGTASQEKTTLLSDLGVTVINYRSGNISKRIAELEPDGIDFIFDGVGEKEKETLLEILQKDGKIIRYATPGKHIFNLVEYFVRILFVNFFAGRKIMEFYGISLQYRRDKQQYKDDLLFLLNLLKEGKFTPTISFRLPLLEAARGNGILEAGNVVGNIVLESNDLI